MLESIDFDNLKLINSNGVILMFLEAGWSKERDNCIGPQALQCH